MSSPVRIYRSFEKMLRFIFKWPLEGKMRALLTTILITFFAASAFAQGAGKSRPGNDDSSKAAQAADSREK